MQYTVKASDSFPESKGKFTSDTDDDKSGMILER